jgi:tripartite-type tricarboxylate transporter receptor subunit TctC
MTPHRRELLKAAAALGIVMPLGLRAQDSPYPSRPVTLVVPFPPGGAVDATMRIIGTHFQRVTGQPLVLENKPGGGSLVAINYLKQQKPDGYTLGVMTRGQFASYWIAGAKNPAHPLNDFTFISATHGSVFLLLAGPGSPYGSLAAVVAAARANPGKVTLGWSGHTHHLTALEFSRLANIELLQVPYKGESESNNALLAGQIDLGVSSGTAISLVEAGKLRVLGVAIEERLARVPGPTFVEQGFPLVMDTTVGIGAPRDMDPGTVAKLDSIFREMVQHPGFVASMATLHQPVKYRNSSDYAKDVRARFEEERALVERYKLVRN